MRSDRPSPRRLPALLLALAPVAALAQEPQFSNAGTEGCLADPGRARADCVGVSADDCMGGAGGGTTVGMGYCLDRERAFWDARLNEVYGKLRAEERAADAARGTQAPSRADALRDMQRAWIAHRDATCAYEAAQWGGGTGQGPAAAGCLMRMTGAQTIYLETYLGEG